MMLSSDLENLLILQLKVPKTDKHEGYSLIGLTFRKAKKEEGSVCTVSIIYRLYEEMIYVCHKNFSN